MRTDVASALVKRPVHSSRNRKVRFSLINVDAETEGSDPLGQENQSYRVLSDSQRGNPQPGKGVGGKQTEEELHRLVNTGEDRREEREAASPQRNDEKVLVRRQEGKAGCFQILLSDKEN